MIDRDITELYLADMTMAFEELDIESIELEHQRYVDFGDIASRNNLVVRAAPLVVALARRLCIPRDFRDDAIQAGNLAVIRSIETWDPSRGHQFTTWAAWKAARNMLREVEKLDGHTVPLDLCTIEWLTMMDDNTDVIDSYDTLQFAKHLSLQIPTENEGNGELESMVLSEQLREAILQLSRKQQKVLTLFLEGQNQTEVADSLGISRQAVKQSYDRIVEALKTFLLPSVDKQG